MTGEHLQISDIALLRNGPLPREEAREFSRHLLNCGECRELLPKPSKQEFLRTVFGEQELGTDGVAVSNTVRNTRLVPLVSSFRSTLRPIFAFGLLLVIAAGIGALFLSFRQTQTDGDLVAVVVAPATVGMDSTQTIPDRGISVLAEPNPKPESNDRREAEKVVRAERNEPKKGTNRRPPQGNGLVESGTRGIDLQCGGITSIGLGTSALEDGIRLTWDKITDAAKYSVYISDLDEKLVDEFETDSGTSYVSKAKFERDNIYKWRLIVKLKNGHTLVGASTKFTLGESNRRDKTVKTYSLQKNVPVNIRCVEN